ncbi:MAG: chondroitinase family polysaccharide lyase [Alistipes sp.]
MRKLIFLLAALSVIASAQGQPAREVADARILSFERSTAPFVASKGSRLSLSDQHYKHGAQSVCWSWSKSNAQLTIAAPVDYLAKNPDPNDTSVSSFIFWVYAPKALPGSLRIEFRKQGRLCAWFDYGLGFTGWRGAWVAFDRDMQGTPEEGMDEVVIRTQDCARGELYFDHLILASFQDVRQHTADFQAPFINAATKSHWLVLLQSWRNPMPPAAAQIGETERADMARVESRLRELLLDGHKAQPMDRLRRNFDTYNIKENADGTLHGKPIWFVRYAETYLTMGHPEVSKLYNDNRQTLRRYNDFMYQIAIAYNATDDAAQRAELARMYVLLVRHLLDQGFAAGSAQGTLHHLGYSMRNFYTAPVLMRDVLQQAGLEHAVQQAMEWFSGVGEVKLPPTVPGIDIDAFNTSLIGRLASIVMLPPTPAKAAYLEAFSRWVDNGYKITEGTSPCFKSDGTVFHHRHHYPAYAVGGFDGGVNAVWLLNGTQFRVSAQSHENLRKALLEMRYYCNLRSFPLALSGRHPDGKGELVPWHYARLALSGTPNGKEPLDRELAAAYLRLAEGADNYTRQFAAQGIKAEPSPEGNRVYGYNASMAQRRGNWLLTVAGHSRYIWSAEIYQHANHYGRYLTHGSVQLLGDGDPIGSAGSGFSRDGWDWCHIPGTTALERPMPEMKADVRNVDTVSGYEEMLLSDEAFAGGVSHKHRDGLFAMKLHEHDKYNGSLRARKSFFLFDNRMIALGSNIENAAPGEVHTTLFQNVLSDPSDAITVDGKMITEFPYHATRNGGTVLQDNLRNAYFIPQGEVHLSRALQHSLDEETDAPTQGNFVRAYINHGGVVSNGRYEYMQVVHASDSEVASYGRVAPYEVRRCDAQAHILRDKPSGTTAYALFEAGAVNEGWLVETSLPSLVMISGDTKALTVSVCDPDLRFYEGPSDEVFSADGQRTERSIYSRKWIDSPSIPSEVRLTLRGHWQLQDAAEGCHAQIEGENTVVSFTCREAATREVNLSKLTETDGDN